MRDTMINFLKKYNESTTVRNGGLITRLYFNNCGKRDFVEDFTYFTNTDYMTDELLESLSSGRSLTEILKKELNSYVMEANIEDLLGLDSNCAFSICTYGQKALDLQCELISLKIKKMEHEKICKDLDKSIQDKIDNIGVLKAVSI